MRKTLTGILFVLIIACSTKSEVVLKDTDYLKHGQRASVFQKVWGEPDETIAFQDYQAKRYFYSSQVGGSWGSWGGSIYGHGSGSTYVPTTVVWIYREKGKALFFQKSYLLYDSPGAVPMVWRLVGWEKIGLQKRTEKIVSVTWTFANIRSGAGDNHPVVTTVKQGDKLTVIGESGEWFNVQLESGQQGWINNRVVK